MLHVAGYMIKMKKILLSVSIIAAVAAIALGVTTAFFSDTEQSTGNTFTAGSLDLKVDSTCHYNGMTCSNNIWVDAAGNQHPEFGRCACTWLEKDLATGDVFFNFTDIKPGDKGENTLSLHVYDNDAYLCAYVENLVNADNTCTEPESLVDPNGLGCGTVGELQNNIHLKIWYDVSDQTSTGAVPCDNIWQPEELVLVEDAVINSNNGIFPLGQLKGDATTCLGVSWSVPGTVGNEIQSDSVTGDIRFYIEQVRNNPNFICPGLHGRL